MRKIVPVITAFSLTCLLVGCATTSPQGTYFRKSSTSKANERTDWGLCGGNFHPDGSVRPDFDRSVLSCMRAKGYETLNDYYVEQFVDFYDPRKPQDVNSPSVETQKACGMQRSEEGLCGAKGYIWRSRLQAFTSCMTKKGYQLMLPRDTWAVQIMEDAKEFNPLFCLTMHRKN